MLTRVLVTGGAGFIGSHLSASLLADGHDVVVVDDLSSGERHRVADGADFHQLSVVESEAFSSLVKEARPSVIYHLAAQSSVTVSVTEPQRDCEVNVAGTLNVLVAAAAVEIPVVFTSTGGALYGNQAPTPTPEEYPPTPLSPYGASKLAGEAYVRTWAAATETPHAICRLGNVYGPAQSPHGEAGVVAIFARHLHLNEAPRLFGYGQATRDFVHVSDVVRALRSAVGAGDIFNIGTGIETEVATIWRVLAEAASTDLEPLLEPLRKGELSRSCIDPSLAKARLGWQPTVSLEAGLRVTLEALTAELERREP
jgi:UDP-glucose 4-epimerase